VLVELARGVLGVGPTFKDPVVDEPVPTLREHVAGQPDPALEVLETARAVEALAQDHAHTAFADDAGRVGDRAVLVEQGGVPHGSTIVTSVAVHNYARVAVPALLDGRFGPGRPT
jgi:hypothetical protein